MFKDECKFFSQNFHFANRNFSNKLV
jgi:hypothetical protein